MVRELNNQFPQVPNSIMTAKQREISGQMEIIEGTLPDDLQGYVFMVAPVGTIDSGGLPFRDGNTFLNGDGMIYRLDFTQKGEVTFKTEIAKPPDYYLDKKIENNPLFPFRSLVKFRNHGITRFSLRFGARNLLNTAFLPIKFPGDTNERLLITYDAGRPYEVNTEALSLLNPVGKRKEWRSAIPSLLRDFLSPILSTAHPVFDTHKNQMFTVNYGRSLSSFLETEAGKTYQEILQAEIRKEKAEIASQKGSQEKIVPLRSQFAGLFLEKLIPLADTDFVDLICWDGGSNLKKWHLINPDGSALKIEQSMHQIGISEDYVVLLDTSFTVGIEQILVNPFPFLPFKEEVERKLRELFTLKPSADSVFYIVRRDDLKEGQDRVIAHKIEIPGEACHFLVDYKNPDRKITIHVAHICAWHVAEWVRDYDRSARDREPLPDYLHGMQQCEMDISRMGRYEIDCSGEKPIIASSKVIYDETCTWGPGLFAYLDRLPDSGMTPDKLDNIYWISFGLWKDLTTNFMYELYQEYKYRIKSREEILELADRGIPATLFRLDTSSNEAMAIADRYQFPPDCITLSPQFVPRSQGEVSSTNGYIVCAVFTPKGDRIWIFEAWDLQKGPICKLADRQLNFGFSLHTTWLQKIGSQKSRYNASIREDYQELIDNLLESREDVSFIDRTDKQALKREIQDLFEKEIYPRFE